ncbi:MAG TPA: PQQ-binding-like beta-propeller repeat protein [Verrucomicrobiae bacterium]|jgi:outer membrane protein assembly factor BamB|nr:PQQ-binding-like beta-propeller repeat protein [Verrucomicrobiae bacterium]
MNEKSTGSHADVVAVKDSNGKPFRALRIWPAVFLIGLMLATRFGPAMLEGGLATYWMIAVFGPLLCCLLMLIWWVAVSRATWKERLSGFIGIAAALALTLLVADPTMRGPGTTYLTLPMGMVAFGLAAIWLAKRPPLVRTGTALAFALAGFGFSALLRNEGMTGEYKMGTHWRWSKTPEALMLAGISSEKPAASVNSPVSKTAETAGQKYATALANPEWPGFRGADRAGRVLGPRISTNWAAHPPEQLWKIRVGPAWSSFAVAGQLLFTQEQRGPMETVVCYDANTGREVWKRELEARLEDPLGGPGPRATPSLADGGLFVTGATGAFMRLNPLTGEIVWKQDLTTVAGRKAPMWGFAASPLVTGGLAIVYAGGPGDKGLLAFDAASGALRWSAASASDSYVSPQLNTILGEPLVLVLSNNGLLLIEPATGRERLKYDWKFQQYRALQPRVIGDNTILLPTPMTAGTRALRITKANGQFAVEELWTSRNLKADFTDLVTYQGYAYGNDAGIWTCIDLKTGERKWKGGRYGKGQALLLENSGLLLIAAEDGQVALVSADPNAYAEVASFKALDGKTWNHPVLIGDRLYVRNAEEAAAYKLPLAGHEPAAAKI